MNVYRYKAISKSGVNVDGVVEAYDEFEAVTLIKRDCNIVLKINEVTTEGNQIRLNDPLWVTDKVLSMVSSQFAILLKAGIPMVRAVTLVSEQTKDNLMKRILKNVASDVAAGYGLAQSFMTNGDKIPAAFTETVRAGEQSGTLELSFEKLAKYFKGSAKMKGKVRGALMYPVFLSVLAAIVISIVMVFTVPTLMSTMESLGGEMPIMTVILIAVATFMKEKWWLILGVILIAVISGVLYGKTEKGKVRYANIAMTIPIIGSINRMKGAAQFANTMATLLSAGLPITNALSATGKVVDNYNLSSALSRSVVSLEEGRRLGDVLDEIEHMPELLKEMTSVGEESGSLESTLTTIGEYYDDEVDAASQRALAMLEPMITVVMGIVIGVIVISVYLPMFTMFGTTPT